MMAFSNALSNKVFMASILLVLGMLMTSVEISGAQSIGVCYGTSGNNLPSEADVVALYKANGIGRMRIYVPNLKTLEALKGSNIELTLTILNDQLQSLTDAGAAKDWFQKYVKAYLPDVKFKYIAVGNEIKPGDAATNYVLPVIQNIQNEVSSANLKDQIKVSTAIDTNLLAKSYPPSDGVFSDASNQFLKPVIEFLANNGAPLLVNVYPYFPYKYNKKDISLPYALFTSPNVVVTDDKSKLGYQNLFDALMDSLYSALEKYNAPNLKIVVSESGWPSAGGEGASVENASTYYKNLIGHVKGGTPKKKEAIETYLFAMFDENVKPGDEDEKHFGLFSPDKNNKYQISFT